MSSIYKKGRDGYYYYQTYIYNPESKKKDKRVFHALRTKDSTVAESKQRELDIQYENQSFIDSNTKKQLFNFSPKSTIAIIIAITVVTFSVKNFFTTDKVKHNSNASITSRSINGFKNNIIVMPNVEPAKPIVEIQIDSKKENIPNNIKTNPEPKLVESEVTIPKYTINRVERLSGVFEQGKVYVTIDQNSSNESRRLLCEHLAIRYSEFSNIVICLYANSRAGTDLAKGNDETVSIEEKKRFWLAMYTYNSVEGEYFDDNPSRYLSIY